MRAIRPVATTTTTKAITTGRKVAETLVKGRTRRLPNRRRNSPPLGNGNQSHVRAGARSVTTRAIRKGHALAAAGRALRRRSSPVEAGVAIPVVQVS